jgi:hypothetical protein
VIRAILHLLNDQPLVVDLFQEPKPDDLTVVCTNGKGVDGKRPVFIDFATSTFVFPMAMVRFVEIPRETDESERGMPSLAAVGAEDTDDLEIDEDFLRRVREA